MTFEHECFFITPIGPEGSQVRQRSDLVLEYIVSKAAGELGLEAIRADQIAAPGLVTSQVLEHVQGARAVVADLTGQNPNVFYELAVRHTLRLPVVLIAEIGEQLPFDLLQSRTIFFNLDIDIATRCVKQIVEHLREAFAGSVDSPVATAVDVASLRSGSPRDQQVAELIREIQQMGSALAEFRSSQWAGSLDPRAQLAGELIAMAKDVYRKLSGGPLSLISHDQTVNPELLMGLLQAASSIALPPREGQESDAITRALLRFRSQGGTRADTWWPLSPPQQDASHEAMPQDEPRPNESKHPRAVEIEPPGPS